MVMCHPQLWWSNRDHGQWLPTIHWGGLSWNRGWGRRCYLSLWYNKVTLWVEASKGTIFIHRYWYWSLFYRILVLLPWTHAVWVQLQLKEGYSHPKGQLHSQLLMRRTTESSGDLYWFQLKQALRNTIQTMHINTYQNEMWKDSPVYEQGNFRA